MGILHFIKYEWSIVDYKRRIDDFLGFGMAQSIFGDDYRLGLSFKADEIILGIFHFKV